MEIIWSSSSQKYRTPSMDRLDVFKEHANATVTQANAAARAMRASLVMAARRGSEHGQGEIGDGARHQPEEGGGRPAVACAARDDGRRDQHADAHHHRRERAPPTAVRQEEAAEDRREEAHDE